MVDLRKTPVHTEVFFFLKPTNFQNVNIKTSERIFCDVYSYNGQFLKCISL